MNTPSTEETIQQLADRDLRILQPLDALLAQINALLAVDELPRQGRRAIRDAQA